MTLALVEVERSLNGATEKFSTGRYVFTFPHCGIKSTEYLWLKTKRLVKDERRSKSKLRVLRFTNGMELSQSEVNLNEQFG